MFVGERLDGHRSSSREWVCLLQHDAEPRCRDSPFLQSGSLGGTADEPDVQLLVPEVRRAVLARCRGSRRRRWRRGCLLIYPAVDLAAGLAVAGVESGGIDSSGIDSNTDGFFVGQDDWVERQYLADDLDLATDPRVSPMHADSHADLAPAIIGIGHHDPLLDQDLAYAKVLAAAGVPTILREYPDLIHGFFGMGGVSASAERAADQLCQDLRTLLTDTSASVRAAHS